MDMDGTGPAVIGKGVGTVGKSVVVHKVAPDRVCGGDDGAAGSGGGWYSGGWFPVHNFAVAGRFGVLYQLVWSSEWCHSHLFGPCQQENCRTRPPPPE